VRVPAYASTRTARGTLHPDHFPDASPSRAAEWEALRARVAEVGLRNSLLIAIAPTATIASIAGCYECIEPQVSNLFKRETLSGEFLQINGYLVKDLKELGLWTPAVRDAIKRSNGSVQGIVDLPQELRTLYRTAWELPQKALIDLAAARTPYIDQSQSLNLFMETPTIGKLSSMYAYAWRSGLKTTYYLRSRPATRIAQTTVSATEAVMCSLENPETCEACQ
jgi:ribonucleoside-diphosphate reductase alpha chain